MSTSFRVHFSGFTLLFCPLLGVQFNSTRRGRGTPDSFDAFQALHFDVEGSARKALASAIGEIIGTYPSYQAAPSFAYIIGEYTLDRNGVLAGPRNSLLILTLDQDGYRTK